MPTVIIEGFNDRNKINRLKMGIDTIVTDGTKLNNKVKKKIQECLDKGEDIYILSDPDDAGDQLANMIQNHYPGIPRIILDKAKCSSFWTGKRFRYGVEWFEEEYLIRLFHKEIFNKGK